MANCWSLKIYVSTPLPGPELDHRHHRKWTRLGLIYILQLDAINYRTNDSTNSPVRLFRTYGKEIQQTISPLYCLEVNNEFLTYNSKQATYPLLKTYLCSLSADLLPYLLVVIKGPPALLPELTSLSSQA
ncbi:hypothetical protein ABKN59_004059 [Abortiporus biennis]